MKKVKKGSNRSPKPKRRGKPKPRIYSKQRPNRPVDGPQPTPVTDLSLLQNKSDSLALAASALGQGDPHAAFDICRQVLEVDPFDAVALNLAGVAAFQAGLAEEAVDLLHAAVSQSPENAEAQTNLGNVLTHLGRESDAAAAYQQAMKSNPDYSEAFFNFGILMEAIGQPAQAVNAFEKTLEQMPHHASAWHGLGNSLKALGRLEEAKTAFDNALNEEPTLAVVRTNLAAVLHELGNFEGAVEQSQMALEVQPDIFEARYNLGTALQEMGRHEEAIEAYEQVLSGLPKHAAAAMNIAYGLQQMGKMAAASKAFERAISLDPGFAKAHANLADLRLQQQNPVAALAICDGFLDRYPGDTTLMAFKAIALCEAGEKEAAAGFIDFDRFLQMQHIGAPVTYGNIASFNTALGAHILSHPSLNYAPQSHATRGGLHSGELLTEPKGPFSDLETIIWTAVDEYKTSVAGDSTHPFLREQPESMKLSIWGVVMETAGHQIPHIHPAAWLSGVYYAKVPDIVGEETGERAGWIVLGRPPDHFHNSTDLEIRAIKPEPGLMLLFPSYIYHHTIPFQTNETRISIAFDLIPT